MTVIDWLPSVDLVCAAILIFAYVMMWMEIRALNAIVDAWAERCDDLEEQRDDLERQLDEYRDLMFDTKSGLNDLVAQLEREEEADDDSD